MKTNNKPVFISWFRRLSERGPAQRDSGNSILGVLGILRSLGILGGKTVRQGVRSQDESEGKQKTVRQRPEWEQKTIKTECVLLNGTPETPSWRFVRYVRIVRHVRWF